VVDGWGSVHDVIVKCTIAYEYQSIEVRTAGRGRARVSRARFSLETVKEI